CLVTDGSGTQYMLSCNHVFARENEAAIGERIDQPGKADNNCRPAGQIGSLFSFNTISFTQDNTIDAALASLTPGVTFNAAMINNLYTPTSVPATPLVGMKVKKVGRTTGLTSGVIGAINSTIKIGYTSGIAT